MSWRRLLEIKHIASKTNNKDSKTVIKDVHDINIVNMIIYIYIYILYWWTTTLICILIDCLYLVAGTKQSSNIVELKQF